MTDPLDYAPPDPPPEMSVPMLTGGFVVGAGGVFFVGVTAFGSLIPIGGMAPPPTPRLLRVGPWLLVAAVAGFGTYALWGRRHRRSFVLGVLLGAGTMALVQGACFAIT